MQRVLVAIALYASLFCLRAEASGFEKSVMWSGKHAGYAAAASGAVRDSQALYFNPAGLAGQSDVSVNFSPTQLKVEGSLASIHKCEKTDDNFIPFAGLFTSYSPNERFGFGVGAYVAGGSRAVYENVDLTGDSPNVTFRPTLRTDLAIKEYAIGAAYEIMPGLRFGAAWRIAQAKGSLSALSKTVTNTAYVFMDVSDAKQTRYNGYRFGLQYEAPSRAWGLGLSYRNGIDFSAAGTATGSVTVISTNATTAATMSPITLGLVLPSQVSFGGFYAISEKFRLLTGVDFAKYSKNQNINVNGTISSALLGGTVTLANIPIAWQDLWNFRLGGEAMLGPVALRGGYALTTRVISLQHAKATLPPPGNGHLFTLGAGTSLAQNLDLDGALEYAWSRGAGTMSATPAGATTKELLASVSTETQAQSIGVHTGITYRF